MTIPCSKVKFTFGRKFPNRQVCIFEREQTANYPVARAAKECDKRRVQYRRFGRTELAMPVLSCGGMRYQFKWQDTALSEIPPDNQANLEATIHRALELGINHIETARGYGTSEMQLGRLLPRLPRSKMIVQTKVAPQAEPAEFLKIFNR